MATSDSTHPTPISTAMEVDEPSSETTTVNSEALSTNPIRGAEASHPSTQLHTGLSNENNPRGNRIKLVLHGNQLVEPSKIKTKIRSGGKQIEIEAYHLLIKGAEKHREYSNNRDALFEDIERLLPDETDSKYSIAKTSYHKRNGLVSVYFGPNSEVRWISDKISPEFFPSIFGENSSVIWAADSSTSLPCVMLKNVPSRASNTKIARILKTQLEKANPPIPWQSVIEIHRNVRNGDQLTPTVKIITKCAKTAEDIRRIGSIGINHRYCYFEKFAKPNNRPCTLCFNCCAIGHTQSVCDNPAVCKYCAKDHPTRECPTKANPRTWVCNACKGNHAFGNKKVCPEIHRVQNAKKRRNPRRSDNSPPRTQPIVPIATPSRRGEESYTYVTNPNPDQKNTNPSINPSDIVPPAENPLLSIENKANKALSLVMDILSDIQKRKKPPTPDNKTPSLPPDMPNPLYQFLGGVESDSMLSSKAEDDEKRIEAPEETPRGKGKGKNEPIDLTEQPALETSMASSANQPNDKPVDIQVNTVSGNNIPENISVPLPPVPRPSLDFNLPPPLDKITTVSQFIESMEIDSDEGEEERKKPPRPFIISKGQKLKNAHKKQRKKAKKMEQIKRKKEKGSKLHLEMTEMAKKLLKKRESKKKNAKEITANNHGNSQ